MRPTTLQWQRSSWGGGDFTCASGVYNGVLYLCERFAGAFERRYGSACGSIYVVPGENFRSGQTSYSKDFVCPEAVEPIYEISVDNARDYLLHLASEGKLLVKFYPERFCIAEDDQDLVEKAVRMYRQSGDEILEQVKDFHPRLLGRVMEACQEDKLKPRRQPPPGKKAMQMIQGQWPGEETTEQLLAQLKELG